MCKQLSCNDLKITISMFPSLSPKEDISASLGKISSENKAVHEFMKASEILIERNAADLGKIRELFQKYGYEPYVKGSTGNISC